MLQLIVESMFEKAMKKRTSLKQLQGPIQTNMFAMADITAAIKTNSLIRVGVADPMWA